MSFEERMERASAPWELLNLLDEEANAESKKIDLLGSKYLQAKNDGRVEEEKAVAKELKALLNDRLARISAVHQRILDLFPDIESVITAVSQVEDPTVQDRFIWTYCNTLVSSKKPSEK